MRRTWLTGVLAGAAVSALVLALSGNLQAQSGAVPVTGRIGCVDIVQVFNEFQRQKDLTDEMNQLQDKIQEENKQRRQKLDALDAELSAMDNDDPTYANRTRDMLAMQIDYKNWADLKKADMTREIAVWSVKIYKEIVTAVEEIARRDGYDMVLYRGQFEAVSMDPDVIKEQIRSIHLLYANPSIDLTAVVTDKLNVAYRAQPRVKMMYVP